MDHLRDYLEEKGMSNPWRVSGYKEEATNEFATRDSCYMFVGTNEGVWEKKMS